MSGEVETQKNNVKMAHARVTILSTEPCIRFTSAGTIDINMKQG